MASGLPSSTPLSAIRDNHRRGTVADFLRQQLRPDSEFELVTWLVILEAGQPQ
jgi:hypothetical protein